MFDVQVRGHRAPALPNPVLASIRAYYRRVTTDASPMGVLVSLVMLLTVGVIVSEVVQARLVAWPCWLSLAAVLTAMGVALGRTFRNARRLAQNADAAEVQSRLARSIYRDHLICLGCMVVVVGLQIALSFGMHPV
ncbi:hypothetical protein FZI91_18030 [Mycobacterium sp. CBMA271]|nr:hypothetical protein [Mycobacteroides sp. CBMA 326]MUM23582.1 hypothetical protein [Mycobacteroides sp. CBMA 271]